jgi:predicted DNA-binding transcriptional regulator YafY
MARQLNASLGELSFHVKYTDAQGVETHRTITPFVLFTHKERTGVHAYCHVKEQMRSFYCDRISNLDPLPVLKKFTHKEIVRLMIEAPRWLQKAFDE